MSTRSGRVRPSLVESSPPRTRKTISPTRSPARARKRSPARRSSPPARPARKSPSRKSPSRPKPESKFPARKSPSRATKETVETVAIKSPVKRLGIKSEVSVKIEDLSGKLEIFRGTRSRRSEYSIKDVISRPLVEMPDITKVNGTESYSEDEFLLRNRKSLDEPPRRSSRLKEFADNLPDIRRSISKSLSKSISKSVSQSIDTYSDEENSEEELRKEKLHTRKLATPLSNSINKIPQISGRWEFGGRVGSALLMFLIPLTVFALLISCNKKCSVKAVLDLSVLKSLSVWLHWQAFVVVLVQFIIQAIFAVTPILGVKADRLDDTGTKYTFNAFFSSVVTVNVIYILHFLEIFDKEALLEQYLRLAVASYTVAVILSIYLYLKRPTDDDLNPYGSTGYTLYDFFMGKEIHPFIGKLDIKIWLSRVSAINTLIFTILIFTKSIHIQLKETDMLVLENYKEILNRVDIQPTIALFSMMQLIYILNFILKEHKITTTFYWQSEGLGYMQIVSSALYPFYFTTISKFVADYRLSLSTNILISASVIFVLGFFIMLISNNIKYEFRRNPLQPSLAQVDSMPTFHGKKLLVGSLWGLLRHPNYTGDILIHIAFALPGIVTQQVMAVVPAFLTTVMLLHRAWRDHARCKRRYGAAWQRYCKRVPSVIMPKVL